MCVTSWVDAVGEMCLVYVYVTNCIETSTISEEIVDTASLR